VIRLAREEDGGMKTMTYAGQIREADYGEAMDVVFVGDHDEPLAKLIQDDLEVHGRRVSVSYFVTDTPKTKDELAENQVRVLLGDATADYTDNYSDVTGYLWTDEELQVGGHDLLAEIQSSIGRHLHLEITYHGRDEAAP
jgi:hypothetical protein